MWPKMSTHFYYLGIYFPIAQGHLLHRAFWQAFFCVIWAPSDVLSVNTPITHINCLEINFPIACTSVTQKNRFRTIYVIVSGLIVPESIPGELI